MLPLSPRCIAPLACLGVALPTPASQGRAPIHKPTTIDSPGSYYVTKDIDCPATCAYNPVISITADDVTLDLDGHTISSCRGAYNVVELNRCAMNSLYGIVVVDGGSGCVLKNCIRNNSTPQASGTGRSIAAGQLCDNNNLP